MSIEGGGFECYVHNFKTDESKSVKEQVQQWNEHCTKNDCAREEGSTRCRDCDKEIKFKNLRFHPFDEQGHKNISLSCPDCQDRQYSDAEVVFA